MCGDFWEGLGRQGFPLCSVLSVRRCKSMIVQLSHSDLEGGKNGIGLKVWLVKKQPSLALARMGRCLMFL